MPVPSKGLFSPIAMTTFAAPPRAFTLSDFDFELPPALIAQHPTPERSASRLLDGTLATPSDRIFRDLPGLLNAGDLLVFNDTKVVKARIFGEKASGGKLELLIERVLPKHEVVAHMKVSKKPLPGAKLYMAGGSRGGFEATLLGRWPDADAPRPDPGALRRLPDRSERAQDFNGPPQMEGSDHSGPGQSLRQHRAQWRCRTGKLPIGQRHSPVLSRR